MLDQLVESRNTSAENTRRSEFLLGTLVVLVCVLVGGWIYSLFNKEYGMGTGDLDLGQLVAPVALPEEAPPPPPEPEQKPERQQQQTNDNEKPTVIEKIAKMEDSLKEPPKIEESRQLKSSPLDRSEAKNYNEGTENRYQRSNADREGDSDSSGLGKQTPAAPVEEKEPEVKVKPKEEPKPTPKPAPKTISGGVVNGKATNLVKPPYPAAARAVRAAGAVNVQVTIDENGNVISASAVSGHPLLRAAAVQAARSSKFSPTMLSGQAVKVTGVIVYNFVP